MWQRLIRQWWIGLGLITLLGCFVGAFHMCHGGSCSALQKGEVFRSHGHTLERWVKEESRFTAVQLRESCDRKVESLGRDYETTKMIEEQANLGPPLGEALEALEVLQHATADLRRFLKTSKHFKKGSDSDYVSPRRAMRSGSSRGIVIAAGGLLPLTNTYATLHILRNVHKSRLPVEIYYNGVEEFSIPMQLAFTDDFKSVTCIDISSANIPGFLKPNSTQEHLFRQQIGFSLKARMLLATSFEDVLVLDSDSIPLCDPEELFELPEYKTSGNLFWPDFWAKDRHYPGPVYKTLNLTDPWIVNPEELTVESGQFFINRKLHSDVIQYMVMLNMYGEHTYKLMAGDKDTYRLAFSLAGKADLFEQIKAPPADALRGPGDFMKPARCGDMFPEEGDPLPHLGPVSNEKLKEVLEKETTYKHAGMIQLTTQGQMAFLHHTADSKWDPRQDFAYFGYPISYVTYPLNPVQAAKVFLDGWLWPDKFVIKDVNACPAEPGLNLWSTIERCHLVDQEQDEAKIAIIPVAEFPELLHAVYEGLRIFQDWQFSFFKNTNPLSSMFENL